MATGRPVIFGEVLFDCFSEEATLGGAPFNVAWHLQGFGLKPLFISRVGDDDLGKRVRTAMSRWEMDTSGLQTDYERPTGRVQVAVTDGQPRYDILPDQAYDYIDHPAVALVEGHGGLAQLYHGTLALRNGVSEATLRGLRDRGKLPVFIDVNLRPPWWDLPKVNEAMLGASCIKLNGDELCLLEAPEQEVELETRALLLRKRTGAEVVLVTRGVAGAFVLSPEGRYGIEAHPVDRVVDTVGAGDGFSAVAILGMIKGWRWPDILERASAFAGLICGYRGAIREDRKLYEAASGQWKNG